MEHTSVHFEIPADQPERAATFYRELFGWDIKQFEGTVAGGMEYWMVRTVPTDGQGRPTVPGVNADQFEPVILKLTPSQNSCRIVGATEGKEDVTANPAADWQIYSSFLEEKVAVKSQKTAKGQYQITSSSPLAPGEYAVVLRPISKSMKFSGGEVARGQGDGLIFDSVWSFAVPADAN